MDNQHRKISGYRELSQAEIDLINRIKDAGLALGQLHAEVGAHLKAQREQIVKDVVSNDEAIGTAAEASVERLTGAEPSRWLAMSRMDFQTGIMRLVRAVAQPTDGF